MQKKILCYNLFIIVLFIINTLKTQAQTFKGGLILGTNMCQIDGDMAAGYTKFGIQAGATAQVQLSEKFSVGLEILYAQKGSRPPYNDFYRDFRIIMDYADIPITLKYSDLIGGMTFEAGASVGRLVRTKFTDFGVEGTDAFFSGRGTAKKWDFDAIFGLQYMFNDKLGIGARYNRSITPIRYDAVSTFRNSGQYHRFISVRLILLLSGKKPE